MEVGGMTMSDVLGLRWLQDPMSRGTIFSKPMEIRIWNSDNKARKKILINACVFFSSMYILSYTVLPLLNLTRPSVPKAGDGAGVMSSDRTECELWLPMY